MYDAGTIEAINAEQLATATDRLLVRGGRLSKQRSTTRSLELPRQLAAPAPRVRRSSQLSIPVMLSIMIPMVVGLVALL